MVLDELTSVFSSVQCVSKANIASCLACGLQIFYCEASNSNLGLFKIRFSDCHCLYHGNERALFARNLPVPCRITDFEIFTIYSTVRGIARFEHFGML
jgi:hypothetical protein